MSENETNKENTPTLFFSEILNASKTEEVIPPVSENKIKEEVILPVSHTEVEVPSEI